MATFILRDQKLWLGGYDYTGIMNAIALGYEAEAVDDTVFGQNTRTMKGGLKTVSAGCAGFTDAATLDGQAFANVGVSDVPFSIGGGGGAAGDVAFTFQAVQARYNPLQGAVGDMAAFDLEAAARGTPLVRGQVLHNATVTEDGVGTALQLGAVGASQTIFAALHVLSIDAGQIEVIVESDDDEGFASGVTRLTFATQTGIGYDWQSLAGAVTDDWWRVSFDLTTATSVAFVVVAGIV